MSLLLVGFITTSVMRTDGEPYVYVANKDSNSVSVIDTTTNTVVAARIPVGTQPEAIAINPVGTRVYVANSKSCGDVEHMPADTWNVGFGI
jgi:YVTN family beta-propeller protein